MYFDAELSFSLKAVIELGLMFDHTVYFRYTVEWKRSNTSEDCGMMFGVKFIWRDSVPFCFVKYYGGILIGSNLFEHEFTFLEGQGLRQYIFTPLTL